MTIHFQYVFLLRLGLHSFVIFINSIKSWISLILWKLIHLMRLWKKQHFYTCANSAKQLFRHGLLSAGQFSISRDGKSYDSKIFTNCWWLIIDDWWMIMISLMAGFMVFRIVVVCGQNHHKTILWFKIWISECPTVKSLQEICIWDFENPEQGYISPGY